MHFGTEPSGSAVGIGSCCFYPPKGGIPVCCISALSLQARRFLLAVVIFARLKARFRFGVFGTEPSGSAVIIFAKLKTVLLSLELSLQAWRFLLAVVAFTRLKARFRFVAFGTEPSGSAVVCTFGTESLGSAVVCAFRN